MGIIVYFGEGESNRNRCSSCKKSIPMNIQRLKVKVGTNWYGNDTFKNICGYCLLEYAKQIDKKKVKSWIAEKVSDAL